MDKNNQNQEGHDILILGPYGHSEEYKGRYRSQSINLRSDRQIDTREPNSGISKYLVKRIQALAIDFCPDVEGNGTTRNVMISTPILKRN
jgi:hypothetical protein